MKHIIAIFAALAAIVATAAAIPQANQAWVEAKLTQATNATLTAANDYTDKAISGAGGITPQAVSNIVDDALVPVTSKLNTKREIDDLDYEQKVYGITISVSGAVGNEPIHNLREYLDGNARMWEFDIIGEDAVNKEHIKFGCYEPNYQILQPGGTIYEGYSPVAHFHIVARKWNGYQTSYDKIALKTDIPAWAMEPNPPESMPDNGVTWNGSHLTTKDGTKTVAAADVGAASSKDMTDTRAIVSTLEGQINGSNVVFAVTNYLSGAYRLDAAKLQIRELRDGSYRTIYNSRDEILLHLGDFETNKLNVTREQLRGEILAVLNSMKTDAWGRRTSTGAPAPTNTVYTTEPQFVFGGGLEYERVAVGAGAVGILADKGAPTYTAGDSGTFLFKDATGENYFGYSMTSGYAIGVKTDDIKVSGNRVTLKYNIVGSCPVVMWCPYLFPGCGDDITGEGWYQLNDSEGNPIEGAPFECAIDTESTPEVATVYIDTGANPRGFFSAWTSVPGNASFKTNMPLDLDAANGGGVVSSDGHTILIPQPNGTWTPRHD